MIFKEIENTKKIHNTTQKKIIPLPFFILMTVSKWQICPQVFLLSYFYELITNVL